jgi:hypothetical protein
VRLKTKNQQHVTLKKHGLIKEFNYDRDYSATIAHIKTIYDAKLPKVELQGVTNYKTITITSVGRRLRDAIALHGFEKDAALEGATLAVAQLHGIGMAHCGICVSRLFVSLETNTVFLGGLEYCRPMGEAPPAGIDANDPAARTAQELDKQQLVRLTDELVLL